MIRSAVALFLCVPVYAGELERFEFVEPHMGTLFRITLYATDAESARAASRAAFHRVKALDESFSDYKPQSEMMRVCREAWREPVRVSRDLFRILEAANALAERTGGAFDVTQGRVIRLWKRAREDRRPPSASEIAEAKRGSGYRKLVLDAANRTVFLKSSGMHIDLGGIGKGYAADEALRALREHGVSRALVAASGDLAIGDAPPDREGWKIRIEPGGTPRVLTLRNTGISTSGDAEQFVEIDGSRYSHIIDPESGAALTNGIGVTVVAGDAMTSDSLATAVSIVGRERGHKLVQSIPGATAWIHERTH
jgi:thiamine biosynthesis lipoprotein